MIGYILLGAVIVALLYLLVKANYVISNFPLILSERLTEQQANWLEAFQRKDKELREITDAYLKYQQKALPVDPDRPMAPPQPHAFKMKPNPPLIKEPDGK